MSPIPQPDFADNQDGRTLAAALADFLDHLHDQMKNPVALSIATGYFNPAGFALLAKRLERLERVRLLLGAEPTVPPITRWRKPGEPRGEKYDAEQVRRALRTHEEGLEVDRNLLGFEPRIDATLRRLIEFLDSGRIEVRRYEEGFVHGKAFLFSDGVGLLSGSSNFTHAGLVTNLELNLGHYQPDVLRKVSQWFEDLWERSAPYDLAELYRARFEHYDPYLIYLRVLYELYGDEIQDERPEGGSIQLTTFQNDGAFRAERILEKFNGVIVADGVGLGKTFLAGKIMERIREQRQRVLLITPAALRDGTWRTFLNREQLLVENISFEQLAADRQLGGEHRHLDNPRDDYALVVIDEAHAFRNPDSQRAQALRTLLQGDPPKKLLLLTATPVNNSLWDLYYLIAYFIGHDAAFADAGIPSLRERFREAQREDPLDLKPDLLFDILDRTTVRRTRHFVKEWYPGETIPGPDGTPITIAFPKPEVSKIDYDLESFLPGFLDEFREALAPELGEPALTMARYWPSRYRTGGGIPDANELGLVGLIRTGLLKRFESSVHSFAETAGRMAEANQAFLGALDRGYVPSPRALEEWQEVDSDEAWEEILAETGSRHVGEYDLARLRKDVTADRDLLRYFNERAKSISSEDDPKLAALVDALAEAARDAEHEGLDEEDVREKRKVIVFTYFEDTVDWIEGFLRQVVQKDQRLEAYRGRIASVSGRETRSGVSRESAVYGFAPRSAEAPKGMDDDLFDILVTTDVLAEGMNLQQCRNIVNYDLPWNPMRLVQRHGRIDRIGSPHKRVFIRCFLPDRQLDQLLDLVLRIHHKLAQAAASVGIESEVIPGSATADRVFGETREEIEKIRKEEADLLEAAGEDVHAHSGEEYRQELRRGLIEREEDILALPWGAGSGFEGLEEGHFFCARVGDRPFLRFVPSGEGDIVSDTLGSLRIIDCEPETDRVLTEEMHQGAYPAWERARRHVYETWTHATDPANLQPYVRPLFREIARHIEEHPPAGLTQDRMDKIVEAVEAPWGLRHERVLREVWQRYEADPPAVRSEALVEKIEELGLQPFQAPKPLEPIEEDEVKLVCWMAVRKRVK